MFRENETPGEQLRSGSYRSIVFAPSGTGASDPITTVESITINATTLTVTYPDTSTEALTPNGNCRYSLVNGRDVVVSPAGVLVARSDGTVAGVFRVAVVLPEQSHTLDELAINLNTTGWFQTNSSSSSFAVSAATGTFAGSSQCDNDPISSPLASCATNAADGSVLSVNPAGGFD